MVETCFGLNILFFVPGGGQSRLQNRGHLPHSSHTGVSCLGAPQAANNCTLALKIDAASSKALYRRAYAGFAKKDYDGAKTDLLNAQKTSPGDKTVSTLLKKVWAGPERVFRPCACAPYAAFTGEAALLAFRAPSVGSRPDMISAEVFALFGLPQQWLSSTSKSAYFDIFEGSTVFAANSYDGGERLIIVCASVVCLLHNSALPILMLAWPGRVAQRTIVTDNRQSPERTANPYPFPAPPLRQVEDILKKQQEKEKKMWSKAFS